MRCAISLASDSISCMVRLPAILVTIAVGTRTPTLAQTSLMTDSSVMSCHLLWPRVSGHPHKHLTRQRAARRLPGIGRDVLAQLLQRHLIELGGLAPLDLGLEHGVLLQDPVARLQRLQFGLQLLGRR